MSLKSLSHGLITEEDVDQMVKGIVECVEKVKTLQGFKGFWKRMQIDGQSWIITLEKENF